MRLTITPDSLQVGVGEPEVPYNLVPGTGGNPGLIMAIPGAMAEPFTLIDANSIELAVAPGQTIRWHRVGADVAEAPLTGGAADASGSGEEAPTSLAQDMAGFSFGMARSMLPAGPRAST